MYKPHSWVLAQNLSKKVRLIHKSLQYIESTDFRLKFFLIDYAWYNI